MLTYSSSASAGAVLSPIDLSGIAALQNIPAGTNVTFRIVNWGGGSGGTWYIFDVLGSSAPDLAISGTVSPVVIPMENLTLSATHAGNFTQGDTGDVYIIAVTNTGTAASAGTVSVTDMLPTGLTATAISGAGWTTNLATLTATRSDSLAAGAGYAPVTITVNVATNAPAMVTNSVMLDYDAQVTFVDDPTTIIALAPIQAWRLQLFWHNRQRRRSGG